MREIRIKVHCPLHLCLTYFLAMQHRMQITFSSRSQDPKPSTEASARETAQMMRGVAWRLNSDLLKGTLVIGTMVKGHWAHKRGTSHKKPPVSHSMQGKILNSSGLLLQELSLKVSTDIYKWNQAQQAKTMDNTQVSKREVRAGISCQLIRKLHLPPLLTLHTYVA